MTPQPTSSRRRKLLSYVVVGPRTRGRADLQISTLHKRSQQAAEKQPRTPYRFDARGNTSNERSTTASTSGKESKEDDGDEPKDSPMPPPNLLSDSTRTSQPVLSSITDRTASKSPVKQLLHKERASLGSSPDENDHSQRLYVADHRLCTRADKR